MTPEARVLAALDALRDAFGDLLAAGHEPAEPAALMTMTDAAHRLGVSRSTATRWADSGAIAVVALDGRRWVPVAELDRIAAARSSEVSMARR
jgi:excisionase family DNA binding protein